MVWEQSKANGRVVISGESKIATAFRTSIPSEAWDNARLIAAAPELLKACQAVIIWSRKSSGTSREVLDKVAAAIGKAINKTR